MFDFYTTISFEKNLKNLIENKGINFPSPLGREPKLLIDIPRGKTRLKIKQVER